MATMKAWAQTELGGVEVLRVLEVPKPQPGIGKNLMSMYHYSSVLHPKGPRDLLVKVIAIATNPVGQIWI